MGCGDGQVCQRDLLVVSTLRLWATPALPVVLATPCCLPCQLPPLPAYPTATPPALAAGLRGGRGSHAPTCGRRAKEHLQQGDDVGVVQAPQDAHLPEHALGIVNAAQHVRDALDRHLAVCVTKGGSWIACHAAARSAINGLEWAVRRRTCRLSSSSYARHTLEKLPVPSKLRAGVDK